METKIIAGENQQDFIERCVKNEIGKGNSKNFASFYCYREWQVQNMDDVRNTDDKELAKLKYETFLLKGQNLKTN